MKSLTIDIGNSSAKLAVFAQGEICHRERVPKITCEMLDKILATHGIDEAILSSVAHADYAIDDFLNNRLGRYVRLSHVTPLPIGIDYATPHTLGTDRIATAVAAWELNPEAPSLVVDAGTAATIDVVDAKGNDITPKSNAVTFTLRDHTQPFVFETIMKKKDAKQYTLKRVFGDWKPDKVLKKVEKQSKKLKKRYKLHEL